MKREQILAVILFNPPPNATEFWNRFRGREWTRHDRASGCLSMRLRSCSARKVANASSCEQPRRLLISLIAASR